MLASPDRDAEHVYFPHRAVTSTVVPMPDSEAVEVGLIGYEGFVGLEAFFGTRRTATTVVVQIGGLAHRIPLLAFRRLVGEAASVPLVFGQYAFDLLETTAQNAACIGIHDVGARLARWLLQIDDRVGTDRLEITHDGLALLLAVRRPAVTRTLGDFRDAHLLRLWRGAIEIVDPAALRARACSCYRPIALARASATA